MAKYMGNPALVSWMSCIIATKGLKKRCSLHMQKMPVDTSF